MNDDALIFGKDKTEKIVSLEINDGYIEVFKSDDTSVFYPNKYWILSSTQLNNKFIRMKGDLHYKWGIQYKEKEEWLKYRGIYRNQDIFSIYDVKEATMVNKGITYFKGMSFKEPSILSFDIESTGIRQDDNAKLLIISNTFRKNGKTERKLFCYDEYNDEKEIIDEWCNWVRAINPSIIIAHNGITFDFPYLQFLAERAGTSLKLGRNDSDVYFNNYSSKFRIDGSRDQEYKKIHIYGREFIDTYFLSIKYDISRSFESYALKKIISQLGLEVKNRQHYDATTIRDNYLIPEEWQKIKQYALHDADDALALYDIMAPPFFYMAQSIPKSYQSICESASGSQINSMMIRSYLQEGHSLPKASDPIAFPGAISFGIPGVYRNVLKLDVASLYPSIMRQHQVYDKYKDPQGNFLKITEYFTLERLKNKKLAKDANNKLSEDMKKYYNDLQESQKILANSLYGFLAAHGLLFNSPIQAAKITEYGRQILKEAIKWATGKEFEEIWNKETDNDK